MLCQGCLLNAFFVCKFPVWISTSRDRSWAFPSGGGKVSGVGTDMPPSCDRPRKTRCGSHSITFCQVPFVYSHLPLGRSSSIHLCRPPRDALFGTCHSWLPPGFMIFLPFGRPGYKDPILTTHGFSLSPPSPQVTLSYPISSPQCVHPACLPVPVQLLPIIPAVCPRSPFSATGTFAHPWFLRNLFQAIILGS